MIHYKVEKLKEDLQELLKPYDNKIWCRKLFKTDTYVHSVIKSGSITNMYKVYCQISEIKAGLNE